VLPSLVGLPEGCIFEARCPLAREGCSDVRPPLAEAEPGHFTACLHWHTLTSDEGRAAAVHTVDTAATHVVYPRPILPDTELLEVAGLVKDFPGPRRGTKVRAVDGTSLAFDVGQTFGLVGESGSGKTTVARAIAGLTPPTGGRVVLEGVELRPTVGKRDREILRRLQMVFQNPESSLNPRHTVRQQLLRPLMRLGGLNRSAASERAAALLQAVRLPPTYLDRYAGELSGGEKQRVAIARAFATDPDLVICDEPVSSLDVSVQGALMNLLLDLQEEEGTSYFFISHDIAAVEHLSHVIGVMYLGRLVEQGDADLVLSPPYHPYTEALLSAVPDAYAATRVPRVRLRGARPAGSEPAEGCPFHPRCPRYLGEICRTVDPSWQVPPERSGAEQEPAARTTREPETVPHAIRCHIPYAELAALQEGDAAQSKAPPERGS
jgi:peptide/nickel transport system ATP-binding protein